MASRSRVVKRCRRIFRNLGNRMSSLVICGVKRRTVSEKTKDDDEEYFVRNYNVDEDLEDFLWEAKITGIGDSPQKGRVFDKEVVSQPATKMLDDAVCRSESIEAQIGKTPSISSTETRSFEVTVDTKRRLSDSDSKSDSSVVTVLEIAPPLEKEPLVIDTETETQQPEEKPLSKANQQEEVSDDSQETVTNTEHDGNSMENHMNEVYSGMVSFFLFFLLFVASYVNHDFKNDYDDPKNLDTIKRNKSAKNPSESS